MAGEVKTTPSGYVVSKGSVASGTKNPIKKGGK